MVGTAVGAVASDGQPRVVKDVRSDDNLRFGRASHDGIRSTVSVPVRIAGRVVGVLNAGSRSVGACSESMVAQLDELAELIGHAVFAAECAQAPQPARIPSVPTGDHGLVAQSAAMRELLGQAQRAALSEATVLLTGETGVGKSLLAKAMHGWSARRTGPFAAVHVADLPATLVESELFGHERGAFTGATQRRLGRFEVASGGTLFLDEIGEAPLAVQSKLLRVTQDGLFERVGGSATLHTDARLIAATHRDLHEATQLGSFRRDLLYRLEIVALHVPPLRERPEDLAPLVERILQRLGQPHGRGLRLSSAAWHKLKNHTWPGNIRELEAVLTRAALLEEGDELQLPMFKGTSSPLQLVTAANAWPTRDEHERRYLVQVLEHTQGRIEGPHGAAELLGMVPSTLRSRCQRLGLSLQIGRPGGKL